MELSRRVILLSHEVHTQLLFLTHTLKGEGQLNLLQHQNVVIHLLRKDTF